MASIIKVDTIQDQDGNNIINENADTITIGASGDTIAIPSGASMSGFTSTGIDDNATSTAITIDSSENVGIGTSSPASLGSNITTLEITGGSTIRQGGIYLSNSDKSVKSYFYGTNALTVLATESNIPLAFSTNNTERMRIVSGGGVNVGSGVVSSASGDGNIVVDEGIYIGTFNGDNQIRSSSAGAGSATLYIGNAAIQVSSDRRLKTNIADTTMSAVDKIKQVRIVDFNWNDPSDTSYNNRNARGTWTGVIAQELIDVFPFAVNAPRNEEDLSIDTESEKKWQVDQAHLVPVLMKAIQEQQTKIEELEAKITALENA